MTHRNLVQLAISLYVKNKLHGLVQDLEFNTVSTHNDVPSPMDASDEIKSTKQDSNTINKNVPLSKPADNSSKSSS